MLLNSEINLGETFVMNHCLAITSNFQSAKHFMSSKFSTPIFAHAKYAKIKFISEHFNVVNIMRY